MFATLTKRRPQAIRLPVEPEESFQRRVEELAWLSGWQLIYHTHDSRRSRAGFPDLVLVRAPRVIFAECKRENAPRRLPWEQQAWKDNLERCPGVEYYLWRPSMWREVEQVLSRRRAHDAVA